MIVWQLDLQLLMQSMPITTDVVSSNSAQADVLEISLCDKDCSRLGTGRGFPRVLRFPPPIKVTATI